jgi:hypothetical protein
MTEKMAGTDLSYMIDSEDINRYLDAGSSRLIKYSELDQYRTIEELLPNDVDYKIILIEQNVNLLEQKNKILRKFILLREYLRN